MQTRSLCAGLALLQRQRSSPRRAHVGVSGNARCLCFKRGALQGERHCLCSASAERAEATSLPLFQPRRAADEATLPPQHVHHAAEEATLPLQRERDRCR